MVFPFSKCVDDNVTIDRIDGNNNILYIPDNSRRTENATLAATSIAGHEI